MKKYSKDIFGAVLFIEGLYFLYTFVSILNRALATFDYSNILECILYGTYIAVIVLFIIAGVGVLKSKNWAIICGWVAVLLPQLVKILFPYSRLPLVNNYLILIVNLIVLVYLSFQWKKMGKVS